MNRTSTAWMLLLTAIAIAIAMPAAAPAQNDRDEGHHVHIGIVAGVNRNQLGVDAARFIQLPSLPENRLPTFSSATGFAPYGGIVVEYLGAGSLALQLRADYDDRSLRRENQGNELRVNLAYGSLEAGLRWSTPLGGLYIVGGPSIEIPIRNSYELRPAGSDGTDQVDLHRVANSSFGVWGGIGYDLPLMLGARRQWYVTPFVEASYLIDQKQPDISDATNDLWNTLSLRGGIQFKFGLAPRTPHAITPPPAPILDATVTVPPGGILVARHSVERMPLLSYIFFDSGSTAIPERYHRLDRMGALTFDESVLLRPQRRDATTGSSEEWRRGEEQLAVYYNALNIVGQRLRRSPAETITLVGSAPDRSEGMAMATAVRDYLAEAFGITPDRIALRGQVRPPHASGTRVTPQEDLPLVAEENRRVEILGSDALLAPVEIRTVAFEPPDNDILIEPKSTEPIDDWSVTISGNGISRTFPPSYAAAQRISPMMILNGGSGGTYTATITATTRSGITVSREKSFELSRREIPAEAGTKYSTLFEFDESKTVEMYDRFLREEVAPMIPDGAAVHVYGYTDAIGESDYNMELSALRAGRTGWILEQELHERGRSATFDYYGFGELEGRMPFPNSSPEGRYYNRTVLIDIVPGS